MPREQPFSFFQEYIFQLYSSSLFNSPLTHQNPLFYDRIISVLTEKISLPDPQYVSKC